jgi:uncharacterized protein (TIGR02145 family)
VNVFDEMESKVGEERQEYNACQGTKFARTFLKGDFLSVFLANKGFLMKITRAVISLMVFVALCHAQAVNISGVVKNSGGSGIEGVTVRLGKADLTTTTGSDGSFILKETTTGVNDRTKHLGGSNNYPVILDDNKLLFNAAEQAEVKVTVYDCNGRFLLTQSKVVSSGDRSIQLPHFADGIHIFRVSVNNEPYAFKSIMGTATVSSITSSGKAIAPVTQSQATAPIDDALLCIKAGYQLSRIVVTKPDTADLQITMTPLDTGTMTDADGNVYKTVRIGNQVWTAENLRTTKYNDNSSIGSAIHFYNNATDAAVKKKWGAVYAWSAVKTGKLAPKGWHVPSNDDWDTLQNYLITHGYNDDGTTSGNRIAKSMAATTDWQASTENGALSNNLSINNASGFSGIPAGWRYWMGDYQDQKVSAYWWTSTAYDGTYSYIRQLWYLNFDLTKTYYTISECSVRLVKDK